jgi:histone deacetylase 11
MTPAVVYSPDYDIHFYGVEKLHPFDTRKYSRAYDLLQEQLGARLTDITVAPPHPISDDDLLLVHTPGYLAKLKQQNYLVQALEFPPLALFPYSVIEERVLHPMRLAAQGTLLAGELALERGVAVNMSGGYHHCSADQGEGFTIYSDVGVVVHKLRQTAKLKPDDRVLIIDLDAHQGNGHERIFHADRKVVIMDMYNAKIYPGDQHAKGRIDWDVPLRPGCDDHDYLELLRARLPGALKSARQPKIALYIAGTDVYERDALGGLRLTEDGVFERDQIVIKALREANIPVMMTLAGGYSSHSYRMVARTVQWIIETF